MIYVSHANHQAKHVTRKSKKVQVLNIVSKTGLSRNFSHSWPLQGLSRGKSSSTNAFCFFQSLPGYQSKNVSSSGGGENETTRVQASKEEAHKSSTSVPNRRQVVLEAHFFARKETFFEAEISMHSKNPSIEELLLPTKHTSTPATTTLPALARLPFFSPCQRVRGRGGLQLWLILTFYV